MAKKFKSKRKVRIPKIIIYLMIFIMIVFFYKFVSSLSVDKVNNKFIKFLTTYYNYYSYKNDKKETPIFEVYNLSKEKINNPSELLTTDLVYYSKAKEKVNPVSNSASEPLVYIYNTHQKESYNMSYVEDYNIVPNVLLMSHIIQEKLNNLGVKTLVEENDITAYLKNNDMDYSKSYEASRLFLKKVMKQNPKLKLIIDLHRDACSYDTSTVTINNERYARIMFVIGKEYETYQLNLNKANDLNNRITNQYPSISRGILEKSGWGVNGVYNQDLSESIILIELGGDKNNIDELINSIDAIVPIIGDYINEKK